MYEECSAMLSCNVGFHLLGRKISKGTSIRANENNE